MSNNLVTALGRLLADQRLIEEFAADPSRVADKLDVLTDDRAAFVAVDAEQLTRQASGLVSKRWHEVSKLLPITAGALGAEGEQLFRFYAPTSWPTGRQRHVLDAWGFLKFLAANRIQGASQREAVQIRSRALAVH